jgi:hypothetical protein
MKLTAVILLSSLFAASAALATTYVRVEKDGSKTYSDRPIPGGVPIEIQGAQTYSAPPQSVTSGSPREQQLLEQMDDFRYTSCRVSPPNDTQYSNPETVLVSVELEPALRVNHKLTLMVDGQPVPGAAGNANRATLTNVSRGTHTVSVLVKNEFGKPMCNSAASFHVQRPSVNSPARR